MNHTRSLSLLLSATVLLAACKKEEAAPAAAPTAEPAAAAPEAAAEGLKSSPAPEGAKVSFAELKDGATVSSPLLVKFAVEGIALAPAGAVEPASGHHHLVIDAELPPPDAPIPANANYVHFGKAQTEATIELTPGTHTLQLVYGNGMHVPFNPPLASDKITVTVK
ncbi:DUF4399 domain-containing protein [uncultured Nevskia sp.]|uniref:DUF4399 domain-containing protein n=1 Tax=uncultured Nevskia sp. TaxID=228950 RepID=UPI0025D7FA3C|nr:DUF4399 domain-containing protein [uncultured Nevskia sp.]